MRIACWIPQAANTHSEHVIFIAPSLQQRLHECSSVLRHTYIACLDRKIIRQRWNKQREVHVLPLKIRIFVYTAENVRGTQDEDVANLGTFSRDKERNGNRSLQLASLEYYGEIFNRITSHLRVTSWVSMFTALTQVTYQNNIHNKIKRNLNLRK